jgi:hypothetical protein
MTRGSWRWPKTRRIDTSTLLTLGAFCTVLRKQNDEILHWNNAVDDDKVAAGDNIAGMVVVEAKDPRVHFPARKSVKSRIAVILYVPCFSILLYTKTMYCSYGAGSTGAKCWT